jgi:dTDP-4-amino-4,6-dideoxygalactose transaminase
VVRVGATPVFVDIKAGDMTLDAEDLRASVLAVRREGDLRPAAVIPVDIFGVPADYDEIQPVAEEERLIVIGDAAQSFGGALGNRRVGTLSPITTLSFYPTKPLGCFGDGGAVLSTLPEDEAALRELRQHGFDSSRKEVNRLGLNSRLDSLQAAVLLTRLEFFEEELVRRARIARHYANRLAGAVRVPEIADAKSSAWAVYTVRSPRRDRVREHLTERGIATALFYDRPLCDYGPYKPYRALSGELPVCRHACETVVSLPMHPYLSDENVEQVVDAVLAAVE